MTMTLTATGTDRPTGAGVREAFARLIETLANASLGARRMREANGLFALDDDELARRGLSRDRIVHHVFAPHFYR
jgi:hypothetical protein